MKEIGLKEIATATDASVLKLLETPNDVIAAATIAKKHKFATLCVKPCDLLLCVEQLVGSSVNPCTVIGFPNGNNTTSNKLQEVQRALTEGAVELDMVMNAGWFIGGRKDDVRAEIANVVYEAHLHDAKVKVILETGLWTPDQIREACQMCLEVGADWTKTGTGFLPDGKATEEAVKLMVRVGGDKMQVKAAGGIRDKETAIKFLTLGCTRLGLSQAGVKAIFGN